MNDDVTNKCYTTAVLAAINCPTTASGLERQLLPSHVKSTIHLRRYVCCACGGDGGGDVSYRRACWTKRPFHLHRVPLHCCWDGTDSWGPRWYLCVRDVHVHGPLRGDDDGSCFACHWVPDCPRLDGRTCSVPGHRRRWFQKRPLLLIRCEFRGVGSVCRYGCCRFIIITKLSLPLSSTLLFQCKIRNWNDQAKKQLQTKSTTCSAWNGYALQKRYPEAIAITKLCESRERESHQESQVGSSVVWRKFQRERAVVRWAFNR